MVALLGEIPVDSTTAMFAGALGELSVMDGAAFSDRLIDRMDDANLAGLLGAYSELAQDGTIDQTGTVGQRCTCRARKAAQTLAKRNPRKWRQVQMTKPGVAKALTRSYGLGSIGEPLLDLGDLDDSGLGKSFFSKIGKFFSNAAKAVAKVAVPVASIALAPLVGGFAAGAFGAAGSVIAPVASAVVGPAIGGSIADAFNNAGKSATVAAPVSTTQGPVTATVPNYASLINLPGATGAGDPLAQPAGQPFDFGLWLARTLRRNTNTVNAVGGALIQSAVGGDDPAPTGPTVSPSNGGVSTPVQRPDGTWYYPTGPSGTNGPLAPGGEPGGNGQQQQGDGKAPSWLMPVAIGAGVLLLGMAFGGRKR